MKTITIERFIPLGYETTLEYFMNEYAKAVIKSGYKFEIVGSFNNFCENLYRR